MELRRFSRRHDEVLLILADFIKSHLPPSFSFSTDLPSSEYMFPHHITTTNMRPDVVWWSDQVKQLYMFELTISFETLVADSRQRKQSKYQDLVEGGKAGGYSTHLLTLEVGSRGMVDVDDFHSLAQALKASQKDIFSLCRSVIRTTLLESYKIWGSRNMVY